MGGFREMAKQQADDLMDQYKYQVETNDDKGFSNSSVFIPNSLPDGVEFFKTPPGEYIIDVIPWFCGGQHPQRAEGRKAFFIDYWVHRGVGALQEWLVCQTRTWRQFDEICQYMKVNRLPRETWDEYRPYRRTVYLVWDHTTPKEEAKGIKVWDVPHFFFAEKMVDQARDPRTGEVVNWADENIGMSAFFKVEKETFYDKDNNKRDGTKWSGHKLIARTEQHQQIPDWVLDQTVGWHLDECIDMHPDPERFEIAVYGKKKTDIDKGATPEDPITRAQQQWSPSERGAPPAQQQQRPEPQQQPQQQDACPGTFGQDADKFNECRTCEQYDSCATRTRIANQPQPAEEPPAQQQPPVTQTPTPAEEQPAQPSGTSRPKLQRRRRPR